MMEYSIIEVMERMIKNASVVDLSYTMEEKMPVWPTHARFGATIYESYEYGDVALQSMVSFGEHCGTHIDAPRHFIPGACPVDLLPTSSVMGRGVKIEAGFVKPRGLLTLESILNFEQENGEIKKGDIVMIHFGWDAKYRLQPDSHEFLSDWPGLSGEAAEYLAGKKVSAVGCDALSLDAFGAEASVCHNALLGSGIPIIENICNLSNISVFTYVIGLPIKLRNGSGSPIRLVALQ
ncbi:MAG: cyclase family protein [Oscillospiraceae bacterium]|nr:cyclase family protein [Oscillospiraceae bacterium]